MSKYPPRLVPKKGHQVLINKLGGRNFLVTEFAPLDLTKFSEETIDENMSVQLSLEEGLLFPDYDEKTPPPPPPPPIVIPVLKPGAEDRVLAKIHANVAQEMGRGERADIDVSGVADVVDEIEEKRAAARAKHEGKVAEDLGRAKDLTRDRLMDEARESRVDLQPAGTAKIPPKTPPPAAKKKAAAAAKKRAEGKPKGKGAAGKSKTPAATKKKPASMKKKSSGKGKP